MLKQRPYDVQKFQAVAIHKYAKCAYNIHSTYLVQGTHNNLEQLRSYK